MEIGGREVDTRNLLDVAMSDTDYDHNSVKINRRMSDNYLRELEKEGDTYMKVLSVKEAKALRAKMEQAGKDYVTLRAALERADVKDDDGDHSDHEDIRMNEWKGEVYVRDDRSNHEEKFSSWKDACDYVLALHEDERFVDKDAKRDDDDDDRHDRDDHRAEDRHHDDRDERDDDLDDRERRDREKKAELTAAIIRNRKSAGRHAVGYDF